MSLAAPPPLNQKPRVSVANVFSAIFVGCAVLTLLFYADRVYQPEAPKKASPSPSASAAPASPKGDAKPGKKVEKSKTYPNFEAIKAAAVRGDSEAQFQLGFRHAIGWSVPRSDVESAKWYKKSADQGHMEAQHKLGLAYEDGHGVTRSKGAARKLLRQAAEQGNPESQYQMAFLTSLKSFGTEKSKREAVEWYRKAANSGHARAQRKLADCYEKGEGVPKDDAEAAKWKTAEQEQLRTDYERSRIAAEQGNPVDQFLVAEKLLSGEGVATDAAEGLRFLKMAAESLCDLSIFITVGNFYRDGKDFAKDEEEGARWIRLGLEKMKQAAENGSVDAQYTIGSMYFYGTSGVVIDKTAAIGWYKIAAENGSIFAAQQLFVIYNQGKGVVIDSIQADKWRRKAVENGDLATPYSMGIEYKHGGEGARIDLVEAAKWLRIAADRGHEYAQLILGKMYLKGEGVPKDEAEGTKWLRVAAENEDPEAISVLFRILARGGVLLDGKKNDEEAIRLYLNIKDISPNQAPYHIGKEFWDENPQDLVAAARWWEMGAKQGDPLAQYSIGLCYEKGDGVTKWVNNAGKWYRKSAEQGNADAQHALGLLYVRGDGVTKDYAEAIKWFRNAAQKGFAKSQQNLGQMYADGIGVPKDEIEGLAWFNIAAASGNESAVVGRDALERSLGRELTLVAQQRSKEIQKEVAARSRDSNQDADPKARPARETPRASGSGAIVSTSGHVLTAAHVVSGANMIKIQTKQGTTNARVIRLDEANDLAVLKLDNGSYEPLAIAPSRAVRLGQSVATIGFPNVGIQGFSPKVTKGEVSSLNGIGDDPRLWQISAPVQPGNSGGPLLDEYGNLIGIVVSKLGMKAAQATGDIPQNVNYALKSTYALALLEPYLGDNPAPPNAVKMKFEDMVAKTQQSVVLLLVY